MRSDLNSQNDDQNNNHDHNDDQHDHGRFHMSVLGNQVNLSLTPLNTNQPTGETISTGPLTITNLSGGIFTVYPDYQDISFTINGGTDTSQSINNVNLTFGPNNITLGNGINVIYGDIRDLTMSITGGTADDGGTYTNFMENDVITMAGNTIIAGNGINVVYGNMDDLTLIAGGNTATNGSISVDQLDGNTFYLGGNTISLGSGINFVYGVMESLSLELNSSSASGAGSFGLSSIGPNAGADDDGLVTDTGNPNVFNLAGNKVIVGNGVNVIYGDLQYLTISVNGGSLTSGASLSDNEIFVNSITMGPNTINAGSGVNTIYGDISDASFSANRGTLNGNGVLLNNFFANNITLTGNRITVGDGANVIYGNLHDLKVSGVGGNGSNLPLNNSSPTVQEIPSGLNVLSMGGNFISAGNGVDQIYGTLHNLLVDGSGGINTSAVFLPGGFSESVVQYKSHYAMGFNTITVGNGSDTLYGDMNDFTESWTGGTASGGLAAGNDDNRPHYTLGNNTITAGNGADTVYGDLHDFLWSLKGGLSTDPGSNTLATNFYAQVLLGNNTIHVGNGADTLYGDMHTFSLSVEGGTVTNGGSLPLGALEFLTIARGVYIGETFTMAGNHITAGNGHDVMFGGLENLTFSAINGTVDGTSQSYIPGVGDAGAYFGGGESLAPGTVTVRDPGTIITFGNDVLVGGAGSDFMSGNALNLSGLNSFFNATQIGETNLNQIVWGNDIFQGGTGPDKIAESLDDHSGFMTMQGADIVTNFKSTDQLIFGNVLDANHNGQVNAADLDAVSTFVNFTVEGHKELAIIFHQPGAGSGLASIYGTAIQNFVNADPSSSVAQILTDVAQYIYQSGSATAETSAAGVRGPTTFPPGQPSGVPGVALPATGKILANDVPTADAPQGALILEGHSTHDYASFVSMGNLVSIHADTASINPWG